MLLPTTLPHSGTVQSAEPHTVQRKAALEREHARVQGTPPQRMNGTSVPAAAPRPALSAATQPPPPPGVTTLRPRRDRDDRDAQEETDGLPRRVRQASLAPQLSEGHSTDAEDPASGGETTSAAQSRCATA